jgi:hypothetical protein
LPAWVFSLLTEPTTGRGIRLGVEFLVAEANDGTTLAVLEGAAAAAVAAALAIGVEDQGPGSQRNGVLSLR